MNRRPPCPGRAAAALAVLATLASIHPQAAFAAPETPTGLPTDRMIVVYRAKGGLAALGGPERSRRVEALSQAAGVRLTHDRPMSGGADVLRLPRRLALAEAEAVAARLRALPEVEHAEPDAIFRPLLVPNDPRYAEQWHYFESFGAQLPAAWDVTIGAPGIVVAVIDTGITQHSELSSRLVPGYDFIHDALVANDGGGRDPDPSDTGDFITEADDAGTTHGGYFKDCGVGPSSWHGTHVAGTIAAGGNDGKGIAGIAWGSKILPVRALGKCGGYTSDIVDGMRWSAGLSVPGVPANQNPAQVLNLSLGGAQACTATYQNAINEIVNRGSVVVVAAGNSNANAGGFSPASCNNVISVAATDRQGGRAYYSNYGAVVDIAAPGGAQGFGGDPNGVLSTLNAGAQGPGAESYEFYQGTSMAAPHVAGIAALMLSVQSSLTPAQVLQVMQQTARSFGGSGCTSSTCGPGIVQAAAALAALSGGPPPTSPPGATPTPTPTRPPGSGTCVEHLADGGFEAGTPSTDWFELSLAFGTPICDEGVCGQPPGGGPRGGAYWAWLGGTEDYELAYLAQILELQPGRATLSLWLRILAGGGTGQLGVYFDGVPVFSASQGDAAAYGSYRKVEVDISAFAEAGPHILEIEAEFDGTGVLSFMVDDVSVQACSGGSVPTPTPVAATPTPTPLPPPAAPSSLAALAGAGSIALEWQPSLSPGVEGYRVYRGIPDLVTQVCVFDPQPINGASPVQGTGYTDLAGLVPGTIYCYAVHAVRGGLLGPPSNVATARFGVVTLAIPDVAAGPGSRDVIVPVRIANADGLVLGAADIWLDYDPALLTAKRVEKTVLTQDYAWSASHTAGRIKVALATGSSAPLQGSGNLFHVVVDVIGTVGTSSELRFVAAETALYDDRFALLPATLASGSLTVTEDGACSRGDLNGDGRVRSVDAAMVLQISVGKLAPDECARAAGDVNGDGQIGASDASAILYAATHDGQWPSIAAGARQAAGALRLSLGSGAVASGRELIVPLRISNLKDVAAFEATLSFDPALVRATHVTVPGLVTSSYMVDFKPGLGVLRLALASSAPVRSNLDTVLAYVHFEALGGVGRTPVTLASYRLWDLYGRDFVRSGLVSGVTPEHGEIVVGRTVPAALGLLAGFVLLAAGAGTLRRRRRR
jgi:subtilisin family serine protease